MGPCGTGGIGFRDSRGAIVESSTKLWEDDFAKLERELDLDRLEVRAEQPLPAKRGAITRLVKEGLSVAPTPQKEAFVKPSEANLLVDNPQDDLGERSPPTPVDNPHAEIRAGTPVRGSNRRDTKWGTPSEKALCNDRRNVVSRAYKRARQWALSQGMSTEKAAEEGRKSHKIAGEAYDREFRDVKSVG